MSEDSFAFLIALVLLGLVAIIARRVIRKIIELISQKKVINNFTIVAIFLIAIITMPIVAEHYPYFYGKIFSLINYELGLINLYEIKFIPEFIIDYFTGTIFIVAIYATIHIVISIFFFVEDKAAQWQIAIKNDLITIGKKAKNSYNKMQAKLAKLFTKTKQKISKWRKKDEEK